MTPQDAGKIIEAKTGQKPIAACDMGKYYVVSVKPKVDDGGIALDNMFSVLKENGNYSEFSPTLDPTKFGEAAEKAIML